MQSFRRLNKHTDRIDTSTSENNMWPLVIRVNRDTIKCEKHHGTLTFGDTLTPLDAIQ